MAVILFRRFCRNHLDGEEQAEISAAWKHFRIFESRMETPPDQMVIGRYSVLPFYEELEFDLRTKGSSLVNMYREHCYIANFHYYHDLLGLTPTTWTDYSIHGAPDDIAYVVKGKTNSRKHQWKRLMFAENKKQALEIASQLATDPLISDQGIIYREYVPLVTFETGIDGLPFTNEYRFFCYGKKIVGAGYYWSNAQIAEAMRELPTPEGAVQLVEKVIEKVHSHVRFYVVDVAESRDRGWIVIELNDGQMSGLSTINPEDLYSNLAAEVNRREDV